ncbi:MAG: UDP-N-acetylmuramoyl-L-alanine--D-glutamate ligase [Betaproteobacteria bacterium]|nr:UDP-N-acetylmuramoyl-L-alanine--D-glutamate ligase [Betaproteobacteria bacterium]
MESLKGRKVVVLGLGDTGLSMTRWLTRRGADVRVADTRAEPPHAAALARELPQVRVAAGAFGEDTLAGAELIAISPGIDRRQAPVAGAIERGVPVAGDVELFAHGLKRLGASNPQLGTAKVLAITGSNGKSTVTAMAGAILRAAGHDTVVAGNIGVPVLDTLAQIEDGAAVPQVFVLELSSFQLESTASLEPAAAAMLNLTEDHLDRYSSMTDYAAAKARVFGDSGIQVLNREDRWSMNMARAGRTLYTFGTDRPQGEDEWGIVPGRHGGMLARGTHGLLELDELPAAGLHNAANALAAHALAHAAGAPDGAAAQALRAFEGLPHRMQKVAEIAGVAFFDDSKGTNVGATVAALSGMGRPVVLIAGGDGKGQDFAPLAPVASEHARAVVLMGRDAGRIERALAGTGIPLERAGDMRAAVEAAYRASRPGDAVLLSPACASYDMFRNYVERGKAFVAAVRRLGTGRG